MIIRSYRRGVAGLIADARPEWEVCGEASTGREAVAAAASLKPDVVVMDISMPDMNGLEATREILKDNPGIEVLILSMHESEQMVHDVLSAGARGYILKRDAGNDLIAALEALRQHKLFFTSGVSEVVLGGYLGRDAPKRQRTALRAGSARGNARSSNWWPKASPTKRSPTFFRSASRRWNPTGPTSWRSSAFIRSPNWSAMRSAITSWSAERAPAAAVSIFTGRLGLRLLQFQQTVVIIRELSAAFCYGVIERHLFERWPMIPKSRISSPR